MMGAPKFHSARPRSAKKITILVKFGSSLFPNKGLKGALPHLAKKKTKRILSSHTDSGAC